MIRHRVFLCTVTCVLVLATLACADEGMWPTYSLTKLSLDTLRARGLQLIAEQLYNPKGGGLADAIVNVSGGTGSFVSVEGLVVTNHHVAYSAVQEQSTPEHNYLRDGFYALTRADELEAQGYTVTVTVGIEDVTARVLGTVNDKMTGLKRYNALDRITKQIIAETEKSGMFRCKVVPMFGGKQYVKYTTFEIRDIRIAYIPPEPIGNYGGETDNWMWPRHTGDFAFLRAYVAPDGKPAEYAKENIPYRPKVWLPISLAGVDEGDLTMTIGFPGSTDRYICSYDLENQINFRYPNYITNSENEIKITEAIGKTDSVIALRTAENLKGIYNYLKKSYGIMDGFKRTNTLEQKREQERGLTAFLASKPELQKQYGRVLPELDSLYKMQQKTQMRDSRLGRIAYASDFFRLASTLYRWASEGEKPDMDRDKGFQSRDTLSAKRRLKNAQTNLVPIVDRELFKYGLKTVLTLPADQKVASIEKQFAGEAGADLDQAISQYVDDLYSKTKVGDLAERMKMFGMTRKELEARNDPFINLAVLLYPEMEAMRERSKEFDGAESRLAPKLVQAYAEWKNGTMYPDANGTIRVSFGSVKGFSSRDAVQYHYHTLLSGVMQKETGSGEFIVPEALKKAYEQKDFAGYVQKGDNDIPIDFLTTNDITNGNSGSPVLNGKGELIGLAFDGNYEAVASDYLYDGELNRTIVVDARYILFLIDKVYHLDGLWKELTVH